ncbi:alpha-galactosidase [Planotetraspora thailandica]|uniref:Alpha-galactosidase n=1 Tax=Planotetraspora thailandica TaxID=487172 RepID=A0A8J3Y0J3_9ACTN|nr:alpha-galactosidase [Planotetraspora thailandica]GII58612.1 alpha-galactosidase [Planotetraspora thailandica]
MTRPAPRWALRTATTSYQVRLATGEGWAELTYWGPAVDEVVEPGPLEYDGPTPYETAADAAACEYAPFGVRHFRQLDLVAERDGGVRGTVWAFTSDELIEKDGTTELRLRFTDELQRLTATLCYRVRSTHDVVERWIELGNEGDTALRLEQVRSAAFNVPTPGGARLHYMHGRWAQEFQTEQAELRHGRFTLESRIGLTGLSQSPWLAVQPLDEPEGPTWSAGLAWTGSWAIDADADADAGLTRVGLGRVPIEAAIELAPGETFTTPVACGLYSGDGLAGAARAWHAYQRGLRRDVALPVVYNSWFATEFDVRADHQLELARTAAELGVETFVVDDGWFVGRNDDRGGLGDWEPDPAKFPGGFSAFVDQVRALGLGFGLWVEPEGVSPRSRLFAEHPDWVYQVPGRAMTTIRNQYVLNLARDDAAAWALETLDGLLSRYDISYLKWDMNRPMTERGAGADLDGRHVANYYRILEALRRDHPGVVLEGCAAGGGRVDLATAARCDVLWPSDNTGPLDRLTIQHGFLQAFSPHLMSSWVTDDAGIFDTSPRSLAFRFVSAMAGVLGIGADISKWDRERIEEAARWIELYRSVRDVVQLGEVHRHGDPRGPIYTVEYSKGGTLVLLTWRTGRTRGSATHVGRPARIRPRGVDRTAAYRRRDDGSRHSGAALAGAGLVPLPDDTADASVVILDRI